MPSLFLYGALADREITGSLLGSDTVVFRPGSVDGYFLSGDQDVWLPLAGSVPGETLDGVILDNASEGTLERARTLCLAAGAQEVRLTGEAGEIVIFAMTATSEGPGTPWDKSRWNARWKQIALNVMDEAMGYAERIDSRTLGRKLPMILARAAAREAASRGKPAWIRSDTGHGAVEVIAEHTPHAGFFVTRQIDLRHPTFGGGMSPQVTREVFVATDAAIVLPYDPKRDRVLLVEQFRMGPFGRGDARPWTLEPVAGRVDAGETPRQTAIRECEEEAGLTLSGLEHISSHYCSPGCSSEYFHLYLGLCDLPETTMGQGGLDSEDEDIRTHVLSYENAMKLLETGEADNGPLVLSMFWLQRERARLRTAA